MQSLTARGTRAIGDHGLVSRPRVLDYDAAASDRRKELRGAGCVDHFIAWSRYPVDLGHNLVLAHDACNATKRDFLAYPAHLERWQVSHLERASELAQRFSALALPHDGERSRAIACWAYEQGEAAGAHAWIDAERFVRLDSSWRDVLGADGLRRVAEPPPPEDRPE